MSVWQLWPCFPPSHREPIAANYSFSNTRPRERFAMTTQRPTTALGFPTTADLRFLPEGPLDLGGGKFSWVGIQHGADATSGSLNLYDLNTDIHSRHDLPGRPGFAFPCSEDHLFVVGMERSLGIFDVRDGSFNVFCDGVDADVENTIINDGLVFEGNLIFGTKDLEFATKKAGLYLYRGSDKQLIRLRDDQICSNGKFVQSDESGNFSLFDIDSPTRTIVRYALDIEEGTLGVPETVIDLTEDPAVPDGMVEAPDGKRLIVAMFHPGNVEHGQTRMYDIVSGEIQCVWETKHSRQNTCPALVNHNGEVKLIVTTAVENMSDEDLAQCPNAGQLFMGETDFSVDSLAPTPRFPT